MLLLLFHLSSLYKTWTACLNLNSHLYRLQTKSVVGAHCVNLETLSFCKQKQKQN